MPIGAKALRLLLDAGLDADTLVAVVEAIDEDGASQVASHAASHGVTNRVTSAERTRRWRQNKASQTTVTEASPTSPEKKNPTPHKKITTPSPSDPKGSSVETPKPPSDPKTILATVLSEETVFDLIAHRKAIKAPITAGAAKGLARDFAAFGDAEAAARTMMARGWRGFRPEWMQDARAGPGSAKPDRPTHASVLRKDLNLDQQFASAPGFFDPDPYDTRPSAFRRAFDHAQQPDPQAERRALLGAERRAERERARVDDG